jgi:WD40 repeat protein/uncharacterized caspase-like protein
LANWVDMARRYALIIGIQDYQHIAPLSKTREDARSMADFLRATGDFQDVFVVRSDATRQDLVAALKRFQEQARGNDALVYFTGHGFGLVDELTDGVTGYLAAANTRVETTGNRVTAQQDGIALASLGTLLEQGNFSSLVMLLDACHSGLLLERGAIEQGLAVFSRKRDYFLITACRGFEQAAAIADQPHSLFTGAVLRGLARENADDQGKVSANRLFDYVARALQNSGQEPLHLGGGSRIAMVQHQILSESQTHHKIGQEEQENHIRKLEYATAKADILNQVQHAKTSQNITPINGAIEAISLVGVSKKRMNEVLPNIQGLILHSLDFGERNCLAGHLGTVCCARYSHDGAMIVSSSDDSTIRLWDKFGNRIREPLRGHSGIVWSVDISPDSNMLVSSTHEGAIWLWDTDGNKIAEICKANSVAVRSVRFSPDGQSIVSGSDDGTINLWDKDRKKTRKTLAKHSGLIYSASFSPDGEKVVSAGDNGEIHLWDKSGNSIKILSDPSQSSSAVWSASFSPDGTMIVSCDASGYMRLWNSEGASLCEPIKAHEGIVCSVSFSPDSTKIASVGIDRLVRVWDLRVFKPNNQPASEIFKGHTNSITTVHFSPDGSHIISGSSDHTIRIWEIHNNPMNGHIKGHIKGGINAVVCSPDGTLIVSAGDDGTIRLWDKFGNSILQPIYRHNRRVLALSFSSCGDKFVSAGDDGRICLWDKSGNLIKEIFHKICRSERPFEQSCWVDSVQFSPDGEVIVGGFGDGEIMMWDKYGNLIRELEKIHHSHIHSISFCVSGESFITGGFDGTVRLWNKLGDPISQKFSVQHEGLTAVKLSPDGQIIASCGFDYSIRLWDKDGNELCPALEGHSNWVNSISFSPDGQTILSGSEDNSIRLWNRYGNPIGDKLEGHFGRVKSVAFSPDGKTIVTGSGDNTIRLWHGGTWEDWLRICCDRLRYHSTLNDPNNPTAVEACEVCRKYVWEAEEN